jgi:hypothetical protein
MDEIVVPTTEEELRAYTTTVFADYQELSRQSQMAAHERPEQGPIPTELIFNLFDAGRVQDAWSLIALLVDVAPSDDALGFVAASVLEDVVRHEATDAIYHQIVERARVNERLRKALGLIYWGGEPDWFRTELQSLGVST